MKTSYQLHIVESGICEDFSYTDKPPVNKKILFQTNNQILVAQANQIQLFDIDEKPIWTNPLIIQGQASQVHYSKNRLLLTTHTPGHEDLNTSGASLLIELESGTVIKEFDAQAAFAAGNDRFILHHRQYQLENPVQNKKNKIPPNINSNEWRLSHLRLIDAEGNYLWEKPLSIWGNVESCCPLDTRLVLTTTSNTYHAWGMLGPALLIDLQTGDILKEFHAESAAAFNKDQFILGLEGYGIFKTELHDRDGNCLQQWQSFGHYAVDENDGIIVFEKDRSIPTNSRVVRLRLDGNIEKGAALGDSQIPKPLKLADGNYLIFDNGSLRIIDKHLQEVFSENLINILPEDSQRFFANLTIEGEKVRLNLRERSAKTSANYFTHYWLLEIKKNQ